VHRVTRDSFAGAACAGPEGPNAPAGHAREDLRSTTTQIERGKDGGHRRREEGGRGSRMASDSARGALNRKGEPESERTGAGRRGDTRGGPALAHPRLASRHKPVHHASPSIAAATSDGSSAARRNAWLIRDTSARRGEPTRNARRKALSLSRGHRVPEKRWRRAEESLYDSHSPSTVLTEKPDCISAPCTQEPPCVTVRKTKPVLVSCTYPVLTV
jgi:hypothetical protein